MKRTQSASKRDDSRLTRWPWRRINQGALDFLSSVPSINRDDNQLYQTFFLRKQKTSSCFLIIDSIWRNWQRKDRKGFFSNSLIFSFGFIQIFKAVFYFFRSSGILLLRWNYIKKSMCSPALIISVAQYWCPGGRTHKHFFALWETARQK